MINRTVEPRPAPLAYSIRDALAAVGIGRSSLYSEIGAGRLKTFKIGARTLIAAEDLESWLDSFRTPAALAAN